MRHAGSQRREVVRRAMVGGAPTVEQLEGRTMFSAADPVTLSYHSTSYNSSMTTYPSSYITPAVKYDLPAGGGQYQLESLSVLSRGSGTAFPANTRVRVRVWDANRTPLYTSGFWDLSGMSAALSFRRFGLENSSIHVSGSFYAGFQVDPSAGLLEFGYKVDSPSGNQYGHSYEYDNYDATWSAMDEDLILDATVKPLVPQHYRITASPDDDMISASIVAGQLRITINGTIVAEADPSLVLSLELLGDAGNDTITIGPGVMAATVDGGLGNDSITGGDGADSLRGDAGNDTIYGGGGDDVLMGNTGDDRLYGEGGADQLQAGLGYDRLEGGIGNDSLYAGDQSDTVYGDEGNDYIEGRGKADTIYGGMGNDTIYGGAGADLIYGEDGDDRMDVGVAAVFHDSVVGGAGSDLVRSDGDDVLSGCEGSWV